jgi:uncharacterized membrane protein
MKRIRSNVTAWSPGLLLFVLVACTEPGSQAPSNEQAAPGEQTGPVVRVEGKAAAPMPGKADESAAPMPGKADESAAPAGAPYTARGQEPGWLLTIADGAIDYQGNYGEKKIRLPAPPPTATANGRRYVTERLIIEITNSRCNDAMSGHGYADQVKVIADGETYEGCGGERRTDWDQ